MFPYLAKINGQQLHNVLFIENKDLKVLHLRTVKVDCKTVLVPENRDKEWLYTCNVKIKLLNLVV